MNHLLGWKLGTYSYVSTNRVTELSGLIRAVRSFGLLHGEIPLVVARFVAANPFLYQQQRQPQLPMEVPFADRRREYACRWPADLASNVSP
jgi:hypothetical protein